MLNTHTCVQPDPTLNVLAADGISRNEDQGTSAKYDQNDLTMQVDLLNTDCEFHCGRAGLCPHFCGNGKACCKGSDIAAPVECNHIFGPLASSFTCVMVSDPRYLGTSAWGIEPGDSNKSQPTVIFDDNGLDSPHKQLNLMMVGIIATIIVISILTVIVICVWLEQRRPKCEAPPDQKAIAAKYTEHSDEEGACPMLCPQDDQSRILRMTGYEEVR